MRLSLVLAALIASLCTTASSAAPLYFHLDMKAGSQNPSHPLAGADISLNASWDPNVLAPLTIIGSGTYRGAVWPVSNTAISMDVSGSPGYDGHYVALLSPSPTGGWFTTNDHSTIGDAIQWPQFKFQVGSSEITIFGSTGPIFSQFDADYFSGANIPTPKPFAPSEVTWPSAGIRVTPGTAILAVSTSGYATYIPEPTSISLAGSAVLPALAALRRRK